VQCPFSDLSASKLRPALVLADPGNGDWILCQITSKIYADNKAIELKDNDFSQGGLKLVSYARPGKLFTASFSLMKSQTGLIKKEKFDLVITGVIKLLRGEI
jgi:mRNA interferase MazF